MYSVGVALYTSLRERAVGGGLVSGQLAGESLVQEGLVEVGEG